MATGYPFKKYNFNVLIDGKAVGYFSEVSAPEMADEPINTGQVIIRQARL